MVITCADDEGASVTTNIDVKIKVSGGYIMCNFLLSSARIERHYMYTTSLCLWHLLLPDAAFTLTTIRPRLVSWSSSWTNRDYRIQS